MLLSSVIVDPAKARDDPSPRASLEEREAVLAKATQIFNGLYRIAAGLNRASSADEVAEVVVEHALELPGIDAAWIFLREDEHSPFRLAASRGLPSHLRKPGVFDGLCTCLKRVLGASESATGVVDCERLEKQRDAACRYHATVPIWLEDRTLGVLNLMGGEDGSFRDEEITLLHSIGNQVAVALERTRLSEGLERLVKLRTARLEAEAREHRRTEARLTETLESITDSFMTLDREWRFTYVNRQAEHLLSRSREDLLGRTLWDEFPGLFESHFGREYRRAVEKQQPVKIVAFYAPLNTWLVVHAYPSSQGLTIYARDIGEERSARQRIAEQAALIDRAHDAIVLRDLDHRVLFWSKGAERLYGRSSAETVGQRYDELQQLDGELFKRAAATVMREGSWNGEIDHITASGRRVTVDSRWTLLRDEEGRPKSILAIATDITERKRAQVQLLESEERYRLLFDRNPHPTWVYDTETLEFLAVNDAAVRHYGYSREEFLKMTIKDIRPPEEVPALMRVMAESPETPAARNYGIFKHRTKDGTMIEVEISSSEITFGGRPAGLVLAMDVTQRRVLEQQVLRAQRMESIGTLAGGIAHDLNNLLMPMMMGVAVLRRNETSASKLRVLDNIERSAKRGKDMVKQVLSFARGVEGSRVPVNSGDVIREVESIVESAFPKNVSIRVDIDGGLWWIDGDPTQLNQVLLNLCVNARDAMPRGGEVRITASNVVIDDQYASMHRGLTAGRYVLVEVADQGVGMPPEVVDRIFEPFFTTKEVGRGTGLGLSTVAAIVRSHGGFVAVYSEVGKGSSFKVYLPAQRIGGAAQPDHEKAVLASPRGNGETILVVDDETSILAITQQTLEAFGYKVLTAEDGAQAIGLYALHREDVAVVITDMMMPVMDGSVLITALRRIDPDVRVIASSGLNEQDTMDQARHAGVDSFLEKPYSAEVLLHRVRSVLDRRS